MERFGQLGNPEPTISSALDIPNDQGGKVKLVWTPSYLDADPTYGIASYWVWRSVPPNVAEAALRQGGELVSDLRQAPRAGVRTFMMQRLGAQSYSWEYVSSQVARGFPSYSMVVSTTSDSVAGSNPMTGFLVEANAATSSAFWNSAPDSGYSVDNLPPVAPAPFTAAYSAGATHLHWGENGEPDLAGYRLYRGNSAGFFPGPGNLVVAQPDTGFADVGPAGSYYKLSAVDIHGNESAFSLVTPGGTLDAASGVPRELALALASANPGRGGATLRYSLPQAGVVRLVIYDLAGREVRVLANGRLEADDYRARWDGRNETGQRVSGGMYVVRLEAEGRALVRRVVLLP